MTLPKPPSLSSYAPFFNFQSSDNKIFDVFGCYVNLTTFIVCSFYVDTVHKLPDDT